MNNCVRLSLVVAMDENNLIGRHNALPWHLPADLAHFKRTTMGRPILMGRKTFESIGRPLPGRDNIVLTTQADYAPAGCRVFQSLDQALDAYADAEELMVIGGAQLYRHVLPYAQRIYLTRVHARLEGDAWFPNLDENVWRQSACEFRPADAKNPHDVSFIILNRV